MIYSCPFCELYENFFHQSPYFGITSTMSQRKSKASLLRSVLTVSGFSIVTRALAFLFKIYLSRTLGAEVMGLYQTAITVFFLFIALSTGGISTVLSRKIAEFNAKNEGEKGFSLLSTALLVGLGLSLLSTAFAYLMLPKSSFFLTDKRAIPLLKIMLPALFSTTFYIIIRGWFWGNKRFLDFSLSEMIEEILRIAFTLLFLAGIFSGIEGATGLAFAFTVSDFIVLAIIIATYFFRGGKISKPRPLGEIVKPATPLTIMKIFASLTGTVVALIIPQGLIAGGMSVGEATESVGRIGAMANPLLFAPNALINSLAVVLIPEMSEANANKDTTKLKEQIAMGLRASIVISCAFLVGYVALGKELTSFLYKDVEAGVYLEKASIILLLAPINAIASSSMNSIGMEKENFLSYLVGGSLMLLASFTLPKRLGIDAVIVADVLFLLTSSSINLYFLSRAVGGGLGVLKTLVWVSVFSIPCIFIGNNLSSLTNGLPTLISIVISGITCVLAYLVLSITFRLIDPKSLLKRKT